MYKNSTQIAQWFYFLALLIYSNIRGWTALLNLLVQKLFRCRKSSYLTRYFIILILELGDRDFAVLQKRLFIFVKTHANQYTITVILSF